MDKKCTGCKEIGKIDDFYNGEARCKSCATKYQKEWRKKNRKKVNERQKKYYSNIETKRKLRSRYLRRYWPGSTPKQAESHYNQLFSDQQGHCLICKKHQSEFKDALCVDHNHQTGFVRGLLCKACNQGIGLLQGDLGVLCLSAAVEYITKTTKES